MPSPLRNRLLLFGSQIRYLLRATFSTDLAAPLPASLPVDVGGPLTVVDTGNRLSITGGVLSASGGASSWGNPGVYSASLARVIGRTVLARITTATATNHLAVGWSGAASGQATKESLYFDIAALDVYSNDVQTASVATGLAAGTYDVAIILRATGSFVFIKGGVFTNWTLLWVGNAGTTTPLFPAVTNHSRVFTADNFRVLDLAPLDSRFASDYGLAAYYAASPDTAVHFVLADGLIECTYAYTGTVCILRYRRVDSVNHWSVRLEVDGSLTLRETLAGVATARGTVAATFTSGQSYRIVVIVEGNVHKVYTQQGSAAPVLRITYTDTNNLFLTATGVENVSSNGTPTNVAMYPRTIALDGRI